jgi:hypothetical protein
MAQYGNATRYVILFGIVAFGMSSFSIDDAFAQVEGQVSWSQIAYPPTGTGVVIVTEPDLNLDPNIIDNFSVEVWSDSDAGGIDLTVTETGVNSGVFQGIVFFTATDESSGHRLRVADGDTVTAEYDDNTIPGGGSTTITSTALISSDTTPPSVSITSPTNGAITNDNTPTISGIASDTLSGISQVDVSIDGGAFVLATGTTSWSFTTSTLSDGSHTIEVRAADGLGNTGSSSINLNIDTSTSVSIVSPSDGSVVESIISISGTTETLATVDVSIDGGTSQSATVTGTDWSLSILGLADGQHIITATATDEVGNIAQSSISFTIDSSTFVTIDFPLDGSVESSVTFLSGNTETGNSVDVIINGGASLQATVTGTSWNLDVPSALEDINGELLEGTYTIQVTATDSPFGHTDSATSSFTVDSSTFVTIDSPVDFTYVPSLTTISGTTESGSTVGVRFGAGQPLLPATVTGTTWSLTVSPLTDGEYTITAENTDAVGNTSGDQITVFVDAVRTLISISSPSDGSTVQSTSSISGTTETGATVNVLIDFGFPQTATVTGTDWSFDIPGGLSDGSHAVVAIATDGLGLSNNDISSFTVDGIAPVISGTPSDISENTDAGQATTTVLFTDPTATDNIDGPVTPILTSSPTAGLSSGSVFPVGITTLTYTATDAVGNSAQTQFTITVTDNESPVISGTPSDITADATNPSGASVTFTAPTASDNVAGTVLVTCDANSGDTFPIGTTTVTCDATDGINPISASFSITINPTTPLGVDDQYLVTQDTLLTLNSAKGVLQNDFDLDGEAITASQTSSPSGDLTLNPDGSFSYHPLSGFLGPDTFTYEVSDVGGRTNTATVEFIVRSPTSVGTLIICGGNESTGDNDSDNICDQWESDSSVNNLKGTDLSIPFTFGPSAGTTCVSNFGCLPDLGNKDIYVEVDWMSEQAPDQSAIQDVVDAFANKGIRLHVLLDEDIGSQILQIPVPGINPDETFIPNGFVALKQNFFGTAQERQDALTEPKILEAKRQIFHYVLFIHQQQDNSDSSGWGEIPGNDFVVSLGSFGGGGKGTPSEQSGTFMHELGHNLGLYHGGSLPPDHDNSGTLSVADFDADNCKPNYLSVMSYSFQFPSYLSDRPLDYSRSVLAPLDETSLDEASGVQASTPPSLSTVYGPVPYSTSSTGVGIDWDRQNGVGGTVTNVNINNLGITGCSSAIGDSSLSGFDDWNKLSFDFRVRPNFDSGISVMGPTGVIIIEEMTSQTVNEIQQAVTNHQITVFDSIPDSALIDPEITRQVFADRISEILVLIQADDFDNAILNIDSLIALVPTIISDQNELDKLLDSLNNWRGTLVSSNETPIPFVTSTPQQHIQQLIENLENPTETPQSKQTSDKISKAIDDLANSLDDKFWTGPNTLDSQHGDEAIHLQEKAVTSLMKITNDSDGTESDIMILYIQEIIEQITQIDRKIAQSAIIDAYANAVNDDNISSAQDEMTQGDKAVSEGKYDDAIHHYEKAWKDVQ